MAGRLKDLLKNHRYRQIPREYSGLDVYFLPDLSAYLKIGSIDKNSNLRWERSVLDWLAGKIEVPRVLDFEMSDSTEYILISEITGEPYSDWLAASTESGQMELLARRIAAKIRELHELPILHCPLDQCLDAKFITASQNIRNGFVDESDFDSDNLGKKASQVFDELTASRPTDEDVVFTHGDMCLPNIIVNGDDVSGFIDFDRGGVADRYQDIALFLRSFRQNSKIDAEIEKAFCDGYGIDGLDQSKLEFYRKLDELF